MSDKWRFDPNEDYTSEEYENGGRNFQRFKNRKNGHNRKNNDSDDDMPRNKKKQTHHSHWR